MGLIAKHGKRPKYEDGKFDDVRFLKVIRWKDVPMVEDGIEVGAGGEEEIKKLTAGGVSLDSDEIECLGLPPRYTLYKKLSRLRMVCDAATRRIGGIGMKKGI